MNLSDIEKLVKVMPRSFGAEYDNHSVFVNLDIIKSFYSTLSDSSIGNVEFAAILSKSKVFSTITYIYSSIEGTIESIGVLMHNGRCNDAFALVRKYCDSIILDIYKYIIVDEFERKYMEESCLEITKDNSLKAWIDSEKAFFSENEMKKVYKRIAEAHPRLTELFKLSPKDTLYHKLRNICNDNVHYNHFYNMLANDYEMIRSQKTLREYLLKKLNEAIAYFFSIHFAFIYESRPGLFMSSDYGDYMSMGEIPPKDSERWVSDSVQKAFDSIIKVNNHLVAEYLRSLDLMDLK